jgi:nitrogen regulatory protein P-II 1
LLLRLKAEQQEGLRMKKIEAVIRVEKSEEVTEALETLGCPGMMITHIEGHGRQKGIVEQFRGREYKVNFLPKIKIEIIVKDSQVDKIISVIAKIARTGEIGDGKIFVSTIEDAMRIRTGERGDVAV